MKLTRNGIAHDLRISPYELQVDYDSGEMLTFVFSSELNRSRFYDRFLDNREKINESLSNRFGFEIANEVLSDIKLYMSVEKRGFLIRKGNETWERSEFITLNGAKLMKKSCNA